MSGAVRGIRGPPPPALDRERLSRTEWLLVSERVARTDRTIEEFDVST